MELTRRHWALTLFAIPALRAAASERVRLPSTVRKFEELTPKANGANVGRAVFDGLNRSGVQIEIHETALAPGLVSHPLHHHAHVEVVLLREGTLDVTIAGKVNTIGAGGVAYFAAESLHNARNVGSQPAQYFVVSLEKDVAVTSKPGPDAGRQTLPAACFRFDDLRVKESANGNRSRDVFDGLTHTGLQVDLHETELGADMAPHAPHRHVHEEIVFLRKGELEVMIEGKTSVVTPGSVVYVASNDFHGWKNAGTPRAHYFVMALGREPKV